MQPSKKERRVNSESVCFPIPLTEVVLCSSCLLLILWWLLRSFLLRSHCKPSIQAAGSEDSGDHPSGQGSFSRQRERGLRLDWAMQQTSPAVSVMAVFTQGHGALTLTGKALQPESTSNTFMPCAGKVMVSWGYSSWHSDWAGQECGTRDSKSESKC